MWKTIPGPLKPSPTRFNGIRKNGYGALHFQSNACDLDIDKFLNPLVKVIRNIYILEVTLCVSLEINILNILSLTRRDMLPFNSVVMGTLNINNANINIDKDIKLC